MATTQKTSRVSSSYLRAASAVAVEAPSAGRSYMRSVLDALHGIHVEAQMLAVLGLDTMLSADEEQACTVARFTSAARAWSDDICDVLESMGQREDVPSEAERLAEWSFEHLFSVLEPVAMEAIQLCARERGSPTLSRHVSRLWSAILVAEMALRSPAR